MLEVAFLRHGTHLISQRWKDAYASSAFAPLGVFDFGVGIRRDPGERQSANPGVVRREVSLECGFEGWPRRVFAPSALVHVFPGGSKYQPTRSDDTVSELAGAIPDLLSSIEFSNRRRGSSRSVEFAELGPLLGSYTPTGRLLRSCLDSVETLSPTPFRSVRMVGRRGSLPSALSRLNFGVLETHGPLGPRLSLLITKPWAERPTGEFSITCNPKI